MHTLKECPNQQGYTASLGNDIIRQQLAGGAARYEIDIVGSSHTVAVNWTVTASDYQYLMAFYRVWALDPNTPFLANLFIDDGTLTEYKCFFVSPPTLNQKSGSAFMVSAQLEVLAQAADSVADTALVVARETV